MIFGVLFKESLDGLVHLVPRNAQIGKLGLYPELIGVTGIGIQVCLDRKLAAQNHVAGVVDVAAVHANFDMKQGREYACSRPISAAP